jgi:hypothetical protein
MRLDRFLTPTGLVAFPWYVGDTGAPGWVFAARFYDLPQVALVGDALEDLLAYGPVDAPVCRHTAGPGAVPVVSRVRRAACGDCRVVETWNMSTDAWVELEAAVTLAHKVAWLQSFPSPAASAAVRWLAREVDGYFKDAYNDAHRRLAPLLSAAQQAVAACPPVLDWSPWLRAAVPWKFADDAAMWAETVASGGSDEQAAAYCAWWGVDVVGRPAGVGPVDGPLAHYAIVTSPSRSTDLWDPFARDVLLEMLGAESGRVVCAVPAEAADALTLLAEMHVVRSARVVDLQWLSDAAASAPVSADVASAATGLWERATPDSCMAAPDDCLEVAAALSDDPVAFDTAARLTPEWTGTGRDLTRSARALARHTPALSPAADASS